MTGSQRLSILVADDHLIVRRGLQNIIEATPDMFVVAQACDGDETIAAFEAHRPDVVLMDLNMPGPRGPEVIAAIREVDPKARIVVLTIQAGDEAAYRSLQAGAAGYLLKDVPCEDIVAAIRTVAAGRSYVPPGLAERLAGRLGQAEFSDREIAVIKLVARGLANRQIAVRLGIGEKAVEKHVAGLLGKLGARDRTQAARLALDRGLFDLGDLSGGK